MYGTDDLERGAREPLDVVVDTLNEICSTATLNLAFRVGEYVIKNLFAGNNALWESARGSCPTYRALAAREDLSLSASALCRAVGVYVLVEQLGGCARWRHLTASHFQEILPLNNELQVTLLNQAESECWSVARLRTEAATYKGSADVARRVSLSRALNRVESNLQKQRVALVQVDVRTAFGATDALREQIEAIRCELNELEAIFLEEATLRSAPLKSDVIELLGNLKSFSKTS